MAPRRLIAGVWGTTRLQLFLLEGAEKPVVVANADGPGAARLQRADFERVFHEATAQWPTDAPTFLAGMVGSTIGWRDVGYTPCPVDVDHLQTEQPFQSGARSVTLVRGLACRNVMGEPDVLRGEEVELCGLLALDPRLRQGRHLVCIPGTHAKWIALENGVIGGFLTSVAGESFAALRGGGVLAPAEAALCARPGSEFLDGVMTALRGRPLLHALFSPRARMVRGGACATDAVERLSGLIIGADVAGALETMGRPDGPIPLVGAPALVERYAAALSAAGCETDRWASQDAGIAGLWRLSRETP